MEKIYCCLVLVLGVIGLSSANVCTQPEVSAQSYTTPDATILTNIGFVAEFSLKCGNGVQNPALFAELGGKTQPVARIGPNKYQVRSYLCSDTAVPVANLEPVRNFQRVKIFLPSVHRSV